MGGVQMPRKLNHECKAKNVKLFKGQAQLQISNKNK